MRGQTHTRDGSGGGEGGKNKCISIVLLQVVMLVIGRDWDWKLCGDESRGRKSSNDAEMNMKS